MKRLNKEQLQNIIGLLQDKMNARPTEKSIELKAEWLYDIITGLKYVTLNESTEDDCATCGRSL